MSLPNIDPAHLSDREALHYAGLSSDPWMQRLVAAARGAPSQGAQWEIKKLRDTIRDLRRQLARAKT